MRARPGRRASRTRRRRRDPAGDVTGGEQPAVVNRGDLQGVVDLERGPGLQPDRLQPEAVHLRDAADRLAPHHPALADLLRIYGLGNVDEAAEHLRSHRELF